MKLISFEAAGEERIGFAHDGRIVDLRSAYEQVLRSRGVANPWAVAEAIIPVDMIEFIRLGEVSLTAAREAEAMVEVGVPNGAPAIATFEFDDITWRPPVPHPSKIFGVAVNSTDLVAESPRLPSYPVYFSKPTSCLVGHRQPIELPDIGATIPEPELAVVIGKKASRITAAAAFDHVYGYSVFNDVTSPQVRQDDLLISRVPLTDPTTGKVIYEDVIFTALARHKGMDSFAPMGPWLVTKDEVPDPHQLKVNGWLSGKPFCADHTSRLRFHVPQVLERISMWSTLLPGDIVSMGTANPSKDWPMRDVDLSREPGPVRIQIEGIGVLENPIKRI